jgi:hypothetical protein
MKLDNGDQSCTKSTLTLAPGIYIEAALINSAPAIYIEAGAKFTVDLVQD